MSPVGRPGRAGGAARPLVLVLVFAFALALVLVLVFVIRAGGTASPVPPAGSSSPAATRSTRPAADAIAKPEASAPASAGADDMPVLAIPVAGTATQTLRDSFDEGRPGHRHEAIDIAAARGTAVLAAADGRLVKLFTSVPGGLTIYQFDASGRYALYYAHLERYADGLREGMALHRGDVIGYVGSTGNASAEAPHLHFALFRLGPDKHWWQGQPVNPYPLLTRSAAR